MLSSILLDFAKFNNTPITAHHATRGILSAAHHTTRGILSAA